ncbi:MAG: hypothetical protein QOG46_761, partial [Pseudonocardiales bacterium]|nr:hypothetical protein [Pseudonocardiales bacterium]
MKRRLRRGVAAAALMAVLGLLSPGVATGQSIAAGQSDVPEQSDVPGQPTGRLQPPPNPNPLARLELSSLSPRVVTVTSTPVLQVSGRVVNVGDRPITNLAIRLQRDEVVSSDDAATRAMQGESEAPHVTRFQPVPGELGPG